MDEETLRSLEDVLVYLLEMCNDCAAKKAAAFEDNILTVFQGEEREFCKVGLGLLKRIMDDCPRQIELLLDDDWNVQCELPRTFKIKNKLFEYSRRQFYNMSYVFKKTKLVLE